MILKDIPSLSPSGFFQIELSIPHLRNKKPSKLPTTCEFLNEEKFAEIFMGWSETGLSLHIHIKKDVDKEDSVELFFNTRPSIKGHVMDAFCHHFIFFPEEREGMPQIEEPPKGHLQENHPSADLSLFSLKTHFKRKSYEMEIDIPKEALYGFGGEDFEKLGFSYRVNRSKGKPQHFSLSSGFFLIDRYPELWAELNLVER